MRSVLLGFVSAYVKAVTQYFYGHNEFNNILLKSLDMIEACGAVIIKNVECNLRQKIYIQVYTCGTFEWHTRQPIVKMS